jgi:hypothetical protein
MQERLIVEGVGCSGDVLVRVVVATAVASRLGLLDGATVAVPVAAWN